MLAANSIEFAKLEVEIEEAYHAAFAETAEAYGMSEYLTMRAAEFGVDRKAAQKAQATVTATGRGEVVAGSRFSTLAGTVFVATETVVVNGPTEIEVEAAIAGSAGNVAAGTINTIPLSIPGITGVTNAEAAHDGYDEESDADLLARYYVVVRTPATSGNVYHYYNWAMSVEGVGACRVLPLWNGNGTVKVIIIDSNHQTASDELLQKVWDYIETVRPIGATVTVTSPEPITINISAAIKGTLDTEALITAANNFLASKYLSLDYVSDSQIINLIMDQASVEDCNDVLLNGTKKVIVGLDKLPTIGEVATHDLSS
jgi:uncharacterized phage protein gp47/JayE